MQIHHFEYKIQHCSDTARSSTLAAASWPRLSSPAPFWSRRSCVARAPSGDAGCCRGCRSGCCRRRGGGRRRWRWRWLHFLLLVVLYSVGCVELVERSERADDLRRLQTTRAERLPLLLVHAQRGRAVNAALLCPLQPHIISQRRCPRSSTCGGWVLVQSTYVGDHVELHFRQP